MFVFFLLLFVFKKSFFFLWIKRKYIKYITMFHFRDANSHSYTNRHTRILHLFLAPFLSHPI